MLTTSNWIVAIILYMTQVQDWILNFFSQKISFPFWILPNYVNVGHRVKRNRLIFCPYFCVLYIVSSSPKSLGSEWGWNSSTFLPWIQTFLDHKYIFDHPCIVFCTDAFRTWSLQRDEKSIGKWCTMWTANIFSAWPFLKRRSCF